MRKVNILWMYDDLLDLYGDWGNLLAIEKGLDAMGIEHETHKKSIGDAVDFAAYDLVYMGPGKARNLEKAAEDLLTRKEEVLSAIESGKLFLVTGNSRLAFGRSFETYSGTTAEGLGLFSCTGTETGNVFISDVLAELAFEKGTESYGFINRTAHLKGDCGEPLFLVKKGAGDGEGESADKEGSLYKNFFGTWQMGPVLVKNPSLLKELLRRLAGEDYKDFSCQAQELALRLTLVEMK
ncbi:MAG: hypothetical protein IIX70_08535 [Oscillospiraceae bacterium]|nr:hypothetical protein [Oscillospiraceae bacterium]